MATANDILYGPSISDDELEGLIRREPGAVKTALKTARKSVANNAGKSAERLRAENLAMKFMPKEVQDALRNGTMTLVPYQFFDTQVVGVASAATLFKNQNIATGLCNVNNGKTLAGIPFVMFGLKVLSGVSATLSATDFGSPSAGVRMGELRFMAGTVTVLDKLPTEAFNSTGDNNREQGLIKVDGIYIPEQTSLEAQFNFAAALAANTNIKVIAQGIAAVAANVTRG